MIPQLFHPDELRAQTLAGFGGVGGGIYPAMPDQHRAFFAALPYLFVATLDEQGWPIATLFTGPPGFLRAPDDTHLRISAPRRSDDPARRCCCPANRSARSGSTSATGGATAPTAPSAAPTKPGGDRRSTKLR